MDFAVGFKTPETIKAINNVKKSVRKQTVSEYLTPETIKELSLKKQYMQSDEFIKDPHNKEMFSLIDNLMAIRDDIGQFIHKHNESNPQQEWIQGTNGFARIKKYLEKNPNLNFFKTAGVTPVDNKYALAKSKIYNKSREVLKNFGK